MDFEQVFADVARVIEGAGVVIMAIGLAVVLVRYCVDVLRKGAGSYRQLRVNLGRVILLGLEILIVGDIIRTIIVETSVQSVLVLGLIVVIRTVLSFALEVEISGSWPWQTRQRDAA
ncbi:DUF1622 domain-containing protein [Kribbella speibonae]|uniref:DUF1622 domain-containing protein n=1 Tax=Kribbella speibonae TaxID=1572660 RepID=A0ABY2AF66_9ACTN|nr:DUF1622 domain-containing protein [Kribbella speibonae]TCC28131.1 DUF1622 domain-containing protein [Kribbella speibonae]